MQSIWRLLRVSYRCDLEVDMQGLHGTVKQQVVLVDDLVVVSLTSIRLLISDVGEDKHYVHLPELSAQMGNLDLV